jgi:hypothetical protein
MFGYDLAEWYAVMDTYLYWNAKDIKGAVLKLTAPLKWTCSDSARSDLYLSGDANDQPFRLATPTIGSRSGQTL